MLAHTNAKHLNRKLDSYYFSTSISPRRTFNWGCIDKSYPTLSTAYRWLFLVNKTEKGLTMLPCQRTERWGRAKKDVSQMIGYRNENNLYNTDSYAVVKQILHIINTWFKQRRNR